MGGGGGGAQATTSPGLSSTYLYYSQPPHVGLVNKIGGVYEHEEANEGPDVQEEI